MEILHRVWKDENEQEARVAFQQCMPLPIEWVHEHPALLEKAAEIKATFPLSLAVAWIAASAILQGAVLVHKAPEFSALDCQQLILPYKYKP
jgi:predicted nucleic acid-binding protein